MSEIVYLDESLSIEELLNTDGIKRAADIIKSGGLVAFPTETVYGLGASAFDDGASEKIYSAKNRASDNPLIVHIASVDDLERIALNISDDARLLISQFFPGPLTLILEKSLNIPYTVTGGLETVGVRMPRNNISRALIIASGVPIAAPSANLSGRPSPTSYSHVVEDLNGRVDMILCGRDSEIGLESTIVDMSTNLSAILRQGAVTFEMLSKYIDVVGDLSESELKSADIPKAPGMKYKHYSPNASVYIVPIGADEAVVESTIRNFNNTSKRVCFIDERDPEVLAKTLFYKFREADLEKYDIILVREVENFGIGRAVMNRLKKAAVGYV